MKKESLNIGPKLSLFWYFRLIFEVKLSPYLKQSQIFQNAKFPAKLIILKFGTKNVLFGYFWAGI